MPAHGEGERKRTPPAHEKQEEPAEGMFLMGDSFEVTHFRTDRSTN
jgi:hypothetical protein